MLLRSWNKGEDVGGVAAVPRSTNVVKQFL